MIARAASAQGSGARSRLSAPSAPMKPTELRFFGAFDQKRFRDEIELEF
jgi:hypothetical protein